MYLQWQILYTFHLPPHHGHCVGESYKETSLIPQHTDDGRPNHTLYKKYMVSFVTKNLSVRRKKKKLQKKAKI